MTSNRVVLHLGVHKTASSSIQQTLGAPENRRVLAARRIVVPASLASNCSGFFMSAFSEHPERYHANVRDGRSLEKIAEQVRVQTDRVATELRSLERSTVVFSGEDGCSLSQAGLEKLREFVRGVVPDVQDFAVLVYTREPVSYVSSAIQENVKGNGRTIAQAQAIHVRATRNRYSSLFQRLAETFGADSVFFRSFEAAIESHGDVVRDFLAWIGVDDDSVRVRRVNESAGSEAIRLLSHLYELGLEVRASDREALLSLPGSRAPLIDRDAQASVLEASARDRAFLKQRFGIDYDAPRPSDAREADHAARADLARRFLDVETRLDSGVRTAARRYLGIDAR